MQQEGTPSACHEQEIRSDTKDDPIQSDFRIVSDNQSSYNDSADDDLNRSFDRQSKYFHRIQR